MIEIDGKKLQDATSVAADIGCTEAEISQLVDDGRVVGVVIGRRLFVEVSSLRHYKEVVAGEQKINEKRAHHEVERGKRMEDILSARMERQRAHRRGMRLKARATAVAVLGLGLMFGAVLQELPLMNSSYTKQVASAPLTKSPAQDAPETQTTQETAKEEGTVLNFSHESVRLSTIESEQSGVLLLPQATSSETLNPKTLFSDEVHIMKDEHGVEYVARVDANGNIVEKIPFVLVPVQHASSSF